MNPVALISKLQHANAELDESIGQLDVVTERTQITQTLTAADSLPEVLLAQVKDIESNEVTRRHAIENKASVLTNAVGTALAALGIAATLLTQATPQRLSTILLLPFLVAAGIYLILSAWYAFHVNRVDRFHTVYLDSLDNWIQPPSTPAPAPTLVIQAAAERYVCIRMNQSLVLKKTNYLYVAETFFREGLLLLGLGAITFFVVLTAEALLLALPQLHSLAPFFSFVLMLTLAVCSQFVVIGVIILIMDWLFRRFCVHKEPPP